AEGDQEPRPLSLDGGGGEAALAGDLQHRGQARRRARQGSGQTLRPAEGSGPPCRGTGRHELETGPRPARRCLPRPDQPLPVTTLLTQINCQALCPVWFQKMLRSSRALSDESRRKLDIAVSSWSVDISPERFFTLLRKLITLLEQREQRPDPLSCLTRKVELL